MENLILFLCDNNKIKDKTDFIMKYNLKHGLKETVAWFSNKDNLKKYKADIYNV